MIMARFMEVGDRVALVRGAVPANGLGHPLPAGTTGTIVGFTRGLPQVQFGVGCAPAIVPPHYLELLSDFDGALLNVPDGDSIYAWDVYVALLQRARGGAQG